MNISTDGQRIKTITQKNGLTFPLGTNAIYIDMLSGLDLQEQLLFGSNININSVKVREEDKKIIITEIFKDASQTNKYRKITRINKEKKQDSLFLVEQTENEEDAQYIINQDSQNFKFIINGFITLSGLGDVITQLYRMENDGQNIIWQLIHKKRTIFDIDLQGNIVDIYETVDMSEDEEERPDEGTSSLIDYGRIDSAVIG